MKQDLSDKSTYLYKESWAYTSAKLSSGSP